ncbi:alpha/beta hydrolase [Bacillus sp. NEB1478]|uniref:alpha/beta fold hydrolase n=1 Tax=Bacillus sp. NEB1478 TaxID=3073816 RepID=UPI002873786F|nr:alpha/beta hydrolase [Bacillus sp. NEB1478]WNB90875.1 alpha/beta hydrolase [Bacillus sp. NEB1478]
MRHIEFLYIEGKILEYSIVGQGAPILIFHGGHSNCYEEFGYAELIEAGYQLITPSRPGYGKTSSEWGKDLDTASNAYIKLLDQLGIDQVHVIAISAGGPSGLHLAASYPERVKSLVLQSAVTKEWLTPRDKEYKAAHLLFRPSTEKHVWKLIGFMSNQFPRFIFKQMLSSFSQMRGSEIWNHISDDDLDAFRKMNNRQRSGSGFLIDIKQTKQIKHSHLNAIKRPVLIMHSKNDSAVPIKHAKYAQENIPNAQLDILNTWGHLIWIGKGSSEVNRKVIDFLKLRTLMIGV